MRRFLVLPLLLGSCELLSNPHPLTGEQNLQCDDGVDNDNDGDIDCFDIGCAQSAACLLPEVCDDTLDNDQNGLVDCNDPACTLDATCEVGALCADNIDNDDDGKIDCLDEGCITEPVCNNQPPIAIDDSFANIPNLNGIEDTQLIINAADLLLNDSDPEGGLLSLTDAVKISANLLDVKPNGNSTISVIPAKDANGAAQLSYTIKDDKGLTSTAIVDIFFAPVNDPPDAINDFINTNVNPDQSVVLPFSALLGNDIDVDSTLQLVSTTDLLGGSTSVDPAAQTITFTPSNVQNQTAIFTYVISDGALSDSATVNLIFNDLLPTANSFITSINQGAQATQDLSLLGNIEGDVPSTLSIVALPANGVVSLVGSVFTYTPIPTFTGTDSFQYQLRDFDGDVSIATVSINVIALCGDGLLGAPEGCDDGNLSAGDGCDALCQQEIGFSCVGSPSFCTSICGDGLLRAGEQCDDNNLTAGDGCSATCVLEFCGDSIVNNDHGLTTTISSFNAQNFPHGVATGDADEDGFDDVFVSNLNSGTVSVFTNNGAGGLNAPVHLPVSSQALYVAANDTNGDGHLDLVTGNSSANSISILLGHGDGTFDPPVVLPAGADTRNIAFGDFNGDGLIDIVAANRASNSLSIFPGLGEGAFAQPLTLPVGVNPNGVVVFDAGQDGHDDIAVAHTGSNEVRVFFGDGNLAFPSQTSLQAGAFTRGLAVSDLNGDLDPDLTATNQADNTVSIFFGGPGNSFSFQNVFPTGGVEPTSLQLDDFDRDFAIDIITTNLVTGQVSILLGDGFGGFNFGSPLLLNAGPNCLELSTDDLNNDGRLDIVTANGSTNKLSVLLNTSVFETCDDGNATPKDGCTNCLVDRGFSCAGAPSVCQPSCGDGTIDPGETCDDNNTVSGDGCDANCTPTACGNGVTAGAEQCDDNNLIDGDGCDSNCTPTGCGNGISHPGELCITGTKTLAAVAQPSNLAIGDLDNDGDDDVVVTLQLTNEIGVYFGGAVLTPGATFPANGSPQSVALADFNQDNFLDAIVANSNTNTASLLLGNGNGTFQPPATLPTGNSAFSVTVGDFNNDSIPDFAVAAQLSNQVSVFFNSGNGIFIEQPPIFTGSNPSSVVAVDFNNDGFDEIVVANTDFAGNFAGSSVFLYGNAGGTFPGASIMAVEPGDGIFALVFEDFNNDGLLDFFSANGNNNTLGADTANGAGVYNQPIPEFAVGATPVSVAVADLNGDGNKDAALACQGPGTVDIRLGDGVDSFPFLVSLFSGLGADAVVIGDVEGDANLEIISANFDGNGITVFSVGAP